MSGGAASAESFVVDLSNCDREPIHVPGAIQPHGVLMVLREPGLTLLQVSENAEPQLGVPAVRLLGQPLELALGEAAGRLRAALREHEVAALNPFRLDLPHPAGGSRTWDAILHRAPGGLVLELEPGAGDDPRSVTGLFERVRRGLARLQATGTLSELCQVMAEEVQALTGMDRVMLYRFDPEWHGEVVAEVTTAGMDGFLGLRFPASDIPAQARELYRRNWLRLIADVEYRASPLVPRLNPDTGEPLDMSGSVLRSVSPIHLEYLRNMGVAASLSVSLLRQGELWGLVACHHRTPRYVPYSVRAACEFLGQTFSVQLGALVDHQERGYALHLAGVGARILERAAARDDWPAAVVDGEPALPALTAADGAAVWANGRLHRVGRTPADDAIAALLAWLDGQVGDAFFTDHLAAHHPPAAAYADVASGLLALRVGRGRGDFLLWFRGEAIRTVTWAGNPAKPVEVEGSAPAHAETHGAPTPRLHPRRSFAAWSETVRAHSLAWRAAEVRAASALRDGLVDIVLRQADALARLAEELRRSNEELEAFTYIASHDLKEPLRGLRAFAEILRDDHAPRLGGEAREQVDTLDPSGRAHEHHAGLAAAVLARRAARAGPHRDRHAAAAGRGAGHAAQSAAGTPRRDPGAPAPAERPLRPGAGGVGAAEPDLQRHQVQ